MIARFTLVLALSIACGASALAQQTAPSSQDIIDALLPIGIEDRPEGARSIEGLVDDGRGITVEGGEPTVPSIDLIIAFEYDSDVLRNEALITLERLGEALTHESFADTRFRIIGHTDARGTEEYNADLSHRRANAVVDYLVANYPIALERLEVDGFGKTMLLPGLDPEDERNRRVEIQNIGS